MSGGDNGRTVRLTLELTEDAAHLLGHVYAYARATAPRLGPVTWNDARKRRAYGCLDHELREACQLIAEMFDTAEHVG